MKLSELITLLEDMHAEHGDVEVRLASQPSWPLEHSVGEVATDWSEEDDETREEPVVVYIGEGSQHGYLNGTASRNLGWR